MYTVFRSRISSKQSFVREYLLHNGHRISTLKASVYFSDNTFDTYKNFGRPGGMKGADGRNILRRSYMSAVKKTKIRRCSHTGLLLPHSRGLSDSNGKVANSNTATYRFLHRVKAKDMSEIERNILESHLAHRQLHKYFSKKSCSRSLSQNHIFFYGIYKQNSYLVTMQTTNMDKCGVDTRRHMCYRKYLILASNKN